MKKLILSDVHEELGGKMVDFAGYFMPVQYEGVNAEHLAVRENVGVFDVSHMGEVFVSGENALDVNGIKSKFAGRGNIANAFGFEDGIK